MLSQTKLNLKHLKATLKHPPPKKKEPPGLSQALQDTKNLTSPRNREVMLFSGNGHSEVHQGHRKAHTGLRKTSRGWGMGKILHSDPCQSCLQTHAALGAGCSESPWDPTGSVGSSQGGRVQNPWV